VLDLERHWARNAKISTREANGDALRAARLVAPSLTSRDIHDEVRGGDGVCRREEDERRFGRDDDEAEAKYSTCVLLRNA